MSGTRSTVGRAALRAMSGTAFMVVAVVACLAIIAALRAPRAIATRDADDVPKSTAGTTTASQGTAVVTLDEEGQEKGGIETAAPKPATYQDQIRAYGIVLGLDRLTTLYNQSIVAGSQLRAAQVKLESSATANDRAKNLLKVFSTAMVQAEAAEATFKIDQANVASAQAQMDVLRNSAVQDWGTKLGAAIVSRGPLADDLVLRKKVLVQLSLQPSTFTSPPTRITLTLGDMRSIQAELLSESTQVDPKIQSIGFWYVAPASVGLIAGTSILAYLPKGDTKPGVGIPPSAVVWQAGKPWVFVRDGSDRFERRAIDEAAPTSDGGYVVPATSISGDKRIVVAGAQTLLSEETKSQIPAQEDDN